ncbi:Vacuolar protein sorting-associated protein 26 [Elasticomyces elasticus]|nr:Vacuolar protein sorting-associated protein 26 [Elasticomyces elasticus]KAK4903908.1 Vacuolar protein sorting-associated protein 26 [Elasticomyces elasticus]
MRLKHTTRELETRQPPAETSETSLLSFGTPLDNYIGLQDTNDRQTVNVKLEQNRKVKALLFLDGETVKGSVTIRPRDGKRLEHMSASRCNSWASSRCSSTTAHTTSYQTSLAAQVSYNIRHAAFVFKNVEKMYEVYHDINVKLCYFVRSIAPMRMADVVREKDLGVCSYRQPLESNRAIKMDVGIEDCLHIEFEYSQSEYHLRDVKGGRIFFLLLWLKVWHVELFIIGHKTAGVPPDLYDEGETLVRFSIMDVPPNRGETIPIRLS